MPLFALLFRAPAPAAALISPVTTIDGASAEIVELGGVAMASDGSGGLVYRKRVDGRPHVFAALYPHGTWQAPQRVDVGQSFESSFPAIGAGEGGRLVVVWTNHYSSTTDGLFSAALEPGSTGFQAAGARRPEHRPGDRHLPLGGDEPRRSAPWSPTA